MDTGALKKAQPETIRILVWLLSFVSFGYATAEFEVTSDRLGVYRPEEHIDNPKDYNDNEDARKFDHRLRGPVRPVELEVDHETGLKNYIANEKGDWATSAAFVKYSFKQSIHHGRLYTNGHGFFKGKDEDLAEGLRLLGQGLHCLEDFSAHSNYVELALRNLGLQNVFPHCGSMSKIHIKGKEVFPIVTGTFGMVDFYHSVLGEATDHFTQSEVNEMDNAMQIAQSSAQSSNPLTTLIKLLSKVPGTRDLCAEATHLQQMSAQRSREIGEDPGQAGGWFSGSRGVEDNDYSGSSRAPDHPDWSMPEALPGQGPNYNNNQDWNQFPGAQSHQQGFGQQQYQAYNAGPVSPPQQWNNAQNPQSFNMGGPSGQAQMQSPSGHFDMSDSQQYPSGPHQGQQPEPWHQQQTAFGGQHQQDSFPQHQQQQPSMGGQPQSPEPQIQTQAGPVNPQQTPAQPLQQPVSAPAGLPGMPDFDPAKTVAQIYPILAFRDKVVRTISAVIEKIPGLEALVDRITETLTTFVLSLLAPFVRPLLKGLTKSLQVGSSGVVESSAQHQFEPWTDPSCTNPTHSMLSKDHFSNVLNAPAGLVAAETVKFIAPRVLFAWQHPDVPLDQINADIDKIFHHPAFRDMGIDIHRNMFTAVEKWKNSYRGADLNDILSSDGVKQGRNQNASQSHAGHTHGNLPGVAAYAHPFGDAPGGAGASHPGSGMHFNVAGIDVGNLASQAYHHKPGQAPVQHGFGGSGGTNYGQYINMASHIPGMQGLEKLNKYANMANKFSGGGGGGGGGAGGMLNSFLGGKRGLDDNDLNSTSRDLGDMNLNPNVVDPAPGAIIDAGPPAFTGPGSIGGAQELHEAAQSGNTSAERGVDGQGEWKPMRPPSKEYARYSGDWSGQGQGYQGYGGGGGRASGSYYGS